MKSKIWNEDLNRSPEIKNFERGSKMYPKTQTRLSGRVVTVVFTEHTGKVRSKFHNIFEFLCAVDVKEEESFTLMY